MLVTLVAQVAVVRAAVGQVSSDYVVHRRLGNLAEGGHQAMDEREDEQETHGGFESYRALTSDANRGTFVRESRAFSPTCDPLLAFAPSLHCVRGI